MITFPFELIPSAVKINEVADNDGRVFLRVSRRNGFSTKSLSVMVANRINTHAELLSTLRLARNALNSGGMSLEEKVGVLHSIDNTLSKINTLW